ncbi:hypothetical protein GOP47_0007058 [Adiantum capillus-veneris]|uniref:Uncharacterized protein n=1 Tax=Adiantum capillus-veneris TaxID=13818 RepID=A0A9D4V076_ADICA|nr:hypothetical protein GOP47_0007058 [Adiantum capillus-veneris]
MQRTSESERKRDRERHRLWVAREGGVIGLPQQHILSPDALLLSSVSSGRAFLLQDELTGQIRFSKYGRPK